jgi:hypothetical protein
LEFAIITVSQIALYESISLEHDSLINYIQIFPNPINAYLNIAGIENPKKYSIYEVLGNIVIEGTCSNNIKPIFKT